MPQDTYVQNIKPLDATFLAMQTQTAPVHVGAVLIYGKQALESSNQEVFDSLSLLESLLREKLSSVEKFTFKLVRFPLDLFNPIWIKDPNFKIENHITRISLDPPYDSSALCNRIGEIWQSPLNLNRPLWHFYLIDNYLEDQIAVVAKVHHSLIDGVSGANLFVQLLDLDPIVKYVPKEQESNDDSRPSFIQEIVKNITLAPKVMSQIAQFQTNYVINLPKTATKVFKSLNNLHKAYGAQAAKKPPLLFTAPRTSMNKAVSKKRTFSYVAFKMTDIVEIKNRFNVTINDVIMTICTNTLRNYLAETKEIPDSPLTALMPISIRDDSDKQIVDNQVSAGVVALPTNEPNILKQLQLVSQNAKNAKELSKTVGEKIFLDVATLLPINLQQIMAKSVYKLIASDTINPPANVIITNVPGPNFALYSNSIPLDNVIPIGALGQGIGICFAIFSYNDRINISILSDPNLISKPERIPTHLNRSFEKLFSMKPQKKTRH